MVWTFDWVGLGWFGDLLTFGRAVLEIWLPTALGQARDLDRFRDLLGWRFGLLQIWFG